VTRSDIEHLAQVMVSLRPRGDTPVTLDEEELGRTLDRMLWAIHASKGNPHFDEGKFRDFVLGKLDGDSRQIFAG
jgi:hypothetical protein